MKIKIVASMTKKTKGKTDGLYEVELGKGGAHKYLPLNEVKEQSGITRVNQYKKAEAWLNTPEGSEWALNVTPATP